MRVVPYLRSWELHHYTLRYSLVMEHSDANSNMTHMIFGVIRHKGPSLGEISDHLATRSIFTKDGASSALLKKGKNKSEKKVMKK